jgi:hypothetical protein
LIPAVAAHNFEEWLTFPSFRPGGGAALERLGLSLQAEPWAVTQLALVMVTAIPALIVIFAAFGRQSRTKDFLVCVVAGIFFANVFLPHIPSAIAAQGYTPGLITATLINLPLCLALWRSAVAEGILSLRQVVGAGVLGAIALFPSIVAMMLLSDRLLVWF